MPFDVGDRISHYELEELIGHGSMADVFRASDSKNNRTVAIKIIHRHLLDQKFILERIVREVESLSSLRHPNIIHLYDHSIEPGMAYLVMEYVDGPTLEQELERYSEEKKPIPLTTALAWMEAVGNAVDHAHQHGLIHRDLKPANVLFRRDGTPVLTDFGLAFLIGSPRISVSNTISGTPAYLSPEQARGEVGDARSDVYSLGVVLYEIMTGRAPFEGTAVSVIMAQVNQQPPPLSKFRAGIPGGVESVVLRALEKSPQKRYQSAMVLIEGLKIAIERSRAAEEKDAARALEPVREPRLQASERPRAETRQVEKIPQRDSVPVSLTGNDMERKSKIIGCGVFILIGFAILVWSLNYLKKPGGNAPPPHLSVGSSVQVSVPGQASTSMLSGCPGGLLKGLQGLATSGQRGFVRARKVCGDEWWYEVEIAVLAGEGGNGTGWIDGDYLTLH